MDYLANTRALNGERFGKDATWQGGTSPPRPHDAEQRVERWAGISDRLYFRVRRSFPEREWSVGHLSTERRRAINQEKKKKRNKKNW